MDNTEFNNFRRSILGRDFKRIEWIQNLDLVVPSPISMFI